MTTPSFLTAFRYTVEITPSGFGGDEGLAEPSRGAFSEVTGLDSTLEIREVREGGYNLGIRRLVEKTTHSTLVLKRGMTVDVAFWQWIARCTDGSFPLPYVDGTIVIFPANTATDDSNGAEFAFTNGIVTNVVGPSLNAGEASAVPIEELHIAHEGLWRVGA